MKTKTLPVVALALASTNAIAEEQSLFAGTLASEQTVDNLVDYRNENGAQVTAETIETFPELATASEIGVRTPKFLDSRLNGTFTIESQAYNAFVERFFGDNLVRAGMLGDGTEVIGGFVGTKLVNENLGLDLDLGYHSELDLRGFVSVEPGQLYASFGGNTNDKNLMSFIGTTNVGNPGFLLFGNADLNDRVYVGRLFLGDRMAVTKEALDFKSHIKTGTEMERVTLGGILDSWPPFDAYVSERFSAVGDFSMVEDEVSLGLKGFYAIKKDFVFGVGYNSSNIVTFELFSKIPRSPLEAWVESSTSLDTGDIEARAYLGGSWGW